MNPNFYIHYEDADNSSELGLRELCNSLLGFEQVLMDIIKMSGIKGDIDIKARASQEGSYIEALIVAVDFVHSLPFDNIHDLKEFFQCTSKALYEFAVSYFSTHDFTPETQATFMDQIIAMDHSIEEWGVKNPVKLNILSGVLQTLLGVFIGYVLANLKKVKYQKKPEEGVPLQKFLEMKKMVEKGRMKKALAPIRDGNVKKIGFSKTGKKVDKESIIDLRDMERLLPDDEQILPTMTNGMYGHFKGVLKNIQSARGDFMKIEVNLGEEGVHLLKVKPEEGKETKEYREFYGEYIMFQGEILRESLYERPKLKLLSAMELMQEELFQEDD